MGFKLKGSEEVGVGVGVTAAPGAVKVQKVETQGALPVLMNVLFGEKVGGAEVTMFGSLNEDQTEFLPSEGHMDIWGMGLKTTASITLGRRSKHVCRRLKPDVIGEIVAKLGLKEVVPDNDEYVVQDNGHDELYVVYTYKPIE